VDSVPCLQAWAESLTGISYPLLSDFYPHGKVAQSFGVLRSDGRSERALFIIDKQGMIRYVDVHDIDHQPDNEVLFAELEKLEPYYAAQYAARIAVEKKPESQTPAEPAADVVLYCTPWCPACRRARAFLREHQIPFDEINIMHDRAAAAQVREWTGGHETTPTLNVRGTIVVEFDQNRVAKLLGIK